MKREIRDHINVLEERVFQVRDKWPHFRLLLRDIEAISEECEADVVVVSLERGLLYGGFSLIGPMFSEQKFISIDCSPESADERGDYNRAMIEDRRFIKVPTTKRAPIDDTGLVPEVADVVIIPNLVHHVADQSGLFNEAVRILRPGGFLYVFEPLVRELHQIPDDFIRYTPFGLADVLRRAGLEPDAPALEGGPFSVIAYCWTQALQYLPAEVRSEREVWFYGDHLPELLRLDKEFPDNLVRDHTSFPMSFSLRAYKPAGDSS